MSGATPSPARQPARSSRGILSPRLTAFLDRLHAGETPNAGSFCSFCYNPLPADFQRCDHCGQDTVRREALPSLPQAVIEMYGRMRRRESLIVNSLAYLGLALGLALFLGLVAVNVLYLDRALWFFVIATIVFLVASRVLAAILGGVIGDELAYRYASTRLAEEWSRHLTQRSDARVTPTPGVGG